ncbi:MAG: hypothetical protein ACK4JF_02245 [Methylohalobius sp.]
MGRQIVKPIAQTDSAGQSDALFLARLEVEEQHRFVRRLIAGLMIFLLLWLAGLLYFERPALRQWWQSTVRAQSATPKAVGTASAETAQLERLNLELVRLREQLGKAVTETLTIKLDALEDRIRMGRAGLQDLELIQSIKKDIGLLTARGGQPSSFTGQSLAAVPPLPQAEGAVPDVALLERFSRLETLVYLSLGVFSVILIAAGSYFFRCSAQLKRLETNLSRLSAQLPLQRRAS